jgi:hypothetical protein
MNIGHNRLRRASRKYRKERQTGGRKLIPRRGKARSSQMFRVSREIRYTSLAYLTKIYQKAFPIARKYWRGLPILDNMHNFS